MSHITTPVQNFSRLKLLVIGESTTDIDLKGVSAHVAREAPVPVVQITDVARVPGRAANTAMNGAHLGAQTDFLSVIGNDSEGRKLRAMLDESGVGTASMQVDAARQTQTIQRVVAGDHLLLRFDSGTIEPLAAQMERRLIRRLKRMYPRYDVIMVSDYGYGVLGDRVLAVLTELQEANHKLLVVDSKYLDRYQHVGATVAKPNYQEALTLLGVTRQAAGDQRVGQLQEHAAELLARTGADYVAVTLDIDGSLILKGDNSQTYRTYARPVSNSKAVGAGDTYVVALALALAAGANMPVAAEIAQAAATIVAQKAGTATCRQAELLRYLGADPKYIAGRDELAARVMQAKAEGQKIVFTNGCFDLLHSGHVSYLNQAKAQGDILIVALNSDASVRRLKGPERPINELRDRVRTIAGLGAVDVVVSFDEDTPCQLIEIVQPDVYVKGGDYTRGSLPEAPIVERYGGRIVITPLVQNCSTSTIVSRIHSLSPTSLSGPNPPASDHDSPTTHQRTDGYASSRQENSDSEPGTFGPEEESATGSKKVRGGPVDANAGNVGPVY